MLDEFRTFIAVAEQKSFTQAAKLVNLSQPTVSSQIKRLEAHFGATLIDRSDKAKEISLTENGTLVYRLARQILSALEQTEAAIAAEEGADGISLKIGASLTVGNYYLPSIISRFTAKYRHVRLEISINNTADICRLLHAGRLDIGLIEGKQSYYAFKRVNFSSDHMLLVGSRELGEAANMDAKALREQVWITREQGSGTYEYMRQYLAENQIVPKDTVTFSSNYAIKEALLNNVGITLISEYVVADELKSGAIIRLPMQREIIRDYSYLIREGQPVSPALADFIHLLESNG